MPRVMERNRAKKLLGNTAMVIGAGALGALPGLLSHESKTADTPPAADTSQFIPPDCETMPNPNGWEKPLCEKMAQVGRTILGAYNDGDIRGSSAYQWNFVAQPDGFTIGVSGELPGSYSARFHRTRLGVRLMEVEQTMHVSDGSSQKYDVETVPDVNALADSQLHFDVTRIDPDQSKLPHYLYDSHTQATDTTTSDAMSKIVVVPQFP